MSRMFFLMLFSFLVAFGCTGAQNKAPDLDELATDDAPDLSDLFSELDDTDDAIVETETDSDLVVTDEHVPDEDALFSDEPSEENDVSETESDTDMAADSDTEVIPDNDTSGPLDFDNDPGLDLPGENLGKGIYFSAHPAENTYSDIYRLEMNGLTIENITNTPDKFEYCPALPLNAAFMLYSSADYSDTHLGSIRKVDLDGQGLIVGQSVVLIPSEMKEYDVYGDGSFMQQYTVGRWNPAVSEDGSRIVFTGTYETDETDADGYLILDIELFTADATGANIAPFLPTGDGNPMYMKPLAAEFVHGTARIMASFLGFGPNELSSEIYFEDENGLDMTAYTFYGAWTDGNVAQRGLSAAIHSDELLFYRFVPDASVQNGLYIMGNIVNAPWNETYTGYRAPDETFVIPLTTEQFASHYRPFAFSPDGQIIAVTVYTGSGSDRESRLALIGRDGTVYRVFNLDNALRDIDGLIWR